MLVKSHRLNNLVVTFENGLASATVLRGDLTCKSRSEHVKHRLNLIEFAKGKKRATVLYQRAFGGRICKVAVCRFGDGWKKWVEDMKINSYNCGHV